MTEVSIPATLAAPILSLKIKAEKTVMEMGFVAIITAALPASTSLRPLKKKAL